MKDKKSVYVNPQATLEDFYRHVINSSQGNNHVYRIEATMDDGAHTVRIVFESEKGSVVDQRSRVGKLEVF